MTLPVSSYEELLARVRSLTSETIQLREEISSSLCGEPAVSNENEYERYIKRHTDQPQERISTSKDLAKKQNKMFDEKELEELYDDFLGLDGEDVFFESEMELGKLDNDIMVRDIDMSVTNVPSNLTNNNFLDGTAWSARIDKPDVSIQLDLLNQNIIGLDYGEYERKSKSPIGISDLKATEETLIRPTSCLNKKVDEIDNELKEVDEKLISPSSPAEKNSFHRVGWTPDSLGLWHSGPSNLNSCQPSHKNALHQDLSSSVTGPSRGSPPFGSLLSSTKRTYSHQHLGAKVEMVYNLLSMLDTDNREDMSKTFLAMSSSPESCHAMRQSGCLPLLIQLIHSSELDKEVRNRAADALHNIVHAQADEKRRKREIRVLKLLQQVREYCDELRNDSAQTQAQESDKHPINAIGTLMKLSFDAEHRQAICALGGLHAIADLIQVDHKFHGSTKNDTLCSTLRRYAGMSLTNLTFGDGKNKAFLCSFSKFLLALTDQLKSPSEDLRQVTASVLRNLSWRADSESKQALRNVGAVAALITSAMEAKKESTLKSILSALWNLSAHCSSNKVDICSVPGALAFLVKMLKYKSASNTLSVIENAGGILRNVSSHVAVREDYRQILRDNHCFEVLLEQLRSPSLTIVSNACGTLWNLSARCPEDQMRLWEMGATSMLRSLVQSKHKMISMGSSAALKNLLAAKPNGNLLSNLDSTAKSLGLKNLPTLFVRKKRALEQELNITLSETCENIEPAASSFDIDVPEDGAKGENADGPKRSESHDSVKSTQSDTVYELMNQIAHADEDKPPENTNATLHDSLDGKPMNRRIQDQKLMKRYAASMIPTPTSKKINQDRINEKTREEKGVADDSNARADSEQKNKKGIPILKTKPKRMMREDEVSREHRPSSKLPDDHSVQHGKTEYLERVNAGNFAGDKHDNANSLLNSHETVTGSDLNCKKNAGDESDIGNETKGSHSQCGNVAEHKVEREVYSRESVSCKILTRLRNGAESTNKNFHGKTDSVHNKANSKEADDSFNVNSDGIKVTDHKSGENKPSSRRGDSKNPLRSVPCTARNSHSAANELFSADESSPDRKANSRKFDERRTSQFGFGCQKSDLYDDVLESNDNSHREVKRFDQKAGCGANGDLKSSPGESEKCSTAWCAFDDRKGEIKKCRDEGLFATSDGDEAVSSVYASSAAGNLMNQINESKDGTGGTLHSPVSPLGGDALEKLNSANVARVGFIASSAGCILPKFKVGSPIRDVEVLQIEARKVCGEIQKHRDFEMGCSRTSELSVVSCSSFLDSGDYSLFDSSIDAMNFDDSEMVKAVSKIENNSFPKSLIQAAEPVSLPSLGSLKNDQMEALDLDNSVLSIASITSEIDDNYAQDQVCVSSRTKTLKTDVPNELPEDISGDDATLVSKGDDDTLNTDFLDDDSSLHYHENLPLDPDTHRNDSSDRVTTKLTPKEKRKNFHERYRTYTILDFKASDSFGMAATITRNQGDKSDVVLTKEVEVFAPLPEVVLPRIIGTCGQDDVGWDIECIDKENVNEPACGRGSASQTSYSGRGHESLQFSKSFDKERDCVSEFFFDSKSLSDFPNIGPSERKELVDNAKLVAFSLKTAVRDWETELFSDSETEEPQKSSDIDTATYTKAFRSRAQSRLSFQELQSLQSSEGSCMQNSEKVEAKICRPRDKEEDETLEQSRGIRGRRKPLYSSPQKNPLKIKGFSSGPSNEKTTSVIADAKKPSFQQLCRSPVLHREGTFTKEDKFIQKKSEGKYAETVQERSSILQGSESKNSLSATGKNRYLLRTGGDCKAVGESKVLRTRRPLSTHVSKANDKRMEADTSQRRPFSAGAGSRTLGEGTVTTKRPASTCSPKMRNSSSSQNVKAGNGPARGSSVRPPNLDPQSGKSRSDASLNSVDFKNKGKNNSVSTSKAVAHKTCRMQKTRKAVQIAFHRQDFWVCVGKLKTKKEVVSRIAGLWRKVEETKKNKNSKDNRVWIESENNPATSNEALVTEKEEILHIPTRTVVHSLTYQAFSDETCKDFISRQRSSRNPDDVPSGTVEERQDNIPKRGIISAVVTPFNYSPPVSTVTRSSFAEMDNFQKGSLKVTIV